MLLSRELTPEMLDCVPFWGAVDIHGGPCWEWRGLRSEDGYGRVWTGSTIHRAHRVAWVLTHGAIEPGIFVLHRCDNPPCCRPDHLFLGSQADNIRDAMQKGRLVKPPDPTGENNPSARLDATSARAIRTLVGDGWLREDVAAAFGVSKACVQDIFKGRTWHHV